MRTENGQSEVETRLTVEETEELTRRLGATSEEPADVRANGASTVGDIAESFGLSRNDVLIHLERMRLERAFGAKPAPKTQTGLLALAMVLLGAACTIYAVTPHKLSEAEIDKLLQEQVAKRAKRPKPISYPIQVTVNPPDPLPPTGFTVQVTSSLTNTTSASQGVSKIPTDQEAIAALGRALESALNRSRKEEAIAPQPSKPLPPQGAWHGSRPLPGSYNLFIASPGTSSSSFVRNGRPIITPGVVKLSECEEVAAQVVKAARDLQDQSLNFSPIRPMFGVDAPPAGFSVIFEGRRSVTMSARPISLAPIDADRAGKKLLAILDQLLRQDLQPPKLASTEMADSDAKIPVPAFTKVRLTGPLGPMESELPTAPSDKFPTAADAARARTRMLRDLVNQAMDQLRRVNRGEVPVSNTSE